MQQITGQREGCESCGPGGNWDFQSLNPAPEPKERLRVGYNSTPTCLPPEVIKKDGLQIAKFGYWINDASIWE